ncbi:hypothetical protein B484DRAFT_396785, partial [Ochromonadaceae sp. CCMP2298]
VSFELLKKDGSITKKGNKDLYLICDNGYHKWASMIAPYGLTSVREERLWSEGLESIDSIWFCCCILHNMLLLSDGFASALNTEAAWEALDPEDDNGRARLQMTRVDEIPPLFPAAVPEVVAPQTPRFPALEVYNSMLVQAQEHTPDTPIRPLSKIIQRPVVNLQAGDGHGYEIVDVFEQESEPGFFKLRKELVEHYAKNGPAVHAGLASYIALGCDDEVDEDNQPVEMKIWNGHPAKWGEHRGPPEGNNWWGSRVNQGAFPKPASERISEASRQATLREREDKIAAEAEERRQARLQAQALLASKAKVKEKQRVDGMCEKARLGKKRKHDRDEWEEGDNI